MGAEATVKAAPPSRSTAECYDSTAVRGRRPQQRASSSTWFTL